MAKKHAQSADALAQWRTQTEAMIPWSTSAQTGYEGQALFRRYRLKISTPYWVADDYYTFELDNLDPINNTPSIGRTLAQPLRLVFSVTHAMSMAYSEMTLRIYNLDKSTFERLNYRYGNITLEAGYKKDMALVFMGGFANAYYGWESDGTTYVEILGQSALKPRQSEVSKDTQTSGKTWPAKTPVWKVLATVAKSITVLNSAGRETNVSVECGLQSPADSAKFIEWLSKLPDYPLGRSLDAPARRVMDTLAYNYSFHWTVSGNRLLIFPQQLIVNRGRKFTGDLSSIDKKLKKEWQSAYYRYEEQSTTGVNKTTTGQSPFSLSKMNGMIGSPIIRNSIGEAPTGEDRNILTVTSVLNPKLTIGSYFTLKTDIPTVRYTGQRWRRVDLRAAGMFLVRMANYKGDSHGQDWKVELGAFPISEGVEPW